MVQTLQQRGVLRLPLLELPWTVDVSGWTGLSTGLQFSRLSLEPQLYSSPYLNTNHDTFSRFTGYVAGREAPILQTLAQTFPGSGQPVTELGYVDGWFCNLEKYNVGFDNRIAWNEVRDTASVVNPHMHADAHVSTTPNITDVFQGPMPQVDTLGNSLRVVYATQGGVAFFNIYTLYFDGATLRNDTGFRMNFEGVDLSQSNVWAGTDAFGTACCPADGVNHLVIMRASGVDPEDGPKLITYTLTPGAIYTGANNVTLLALDDPTLDALFQVGFGCYAIRGGFIITLDAGETGPTGQQWEFLVCDAAMTEYVLLQFEPQSAIASAQLSRTTRWSGKVDRFGWFYFNSGDGLDTLHILSTGRLPVTVNPNGPLALPCFQPCLTLP